MKSKLKLSAVIVLLLVSSMTCALAQFGVQFDPATGQPIPGPRSIDPTTGMPIAQATPEWKDENWKDPKIVLTNVNFHGLPISEIALIIREQFKGEFDLLLPQANIPPGSLNQRTGLPMGGETDWSSFAINLRLKNVTASELFNAMNLLFENDSTPLRWELKVIGTRQIALLRLLTQPMPAAPQPPRAPEPEFIRRVYFIGSLIGDEKSGGMSMEKIINTVTDVWKMADHSGKGVTTSALGVEVGGGTIQFHKDAQLLVVSGTPGQIDFMEQTLKALRDKVDLDRSLLSGRSQPKATENNSKPEELKAVPSAR